MSDRWLRLLAPEVVQSSAMDCGPAALKCLCEGFGVPISYGRLREACQTSVDGTSIDVLESVARQLGLDAEQVMLPSDHLFVAEARVWPALVVVEESAGNTHFVVVWRRHGAWLQVMDPAVGRRWMTCTQLARSLHIHTLAVSAEAYRDWALSNEGLQVMRARLSRLGMTRAAATVMLDRIGTSGDPALPARLDAAVRLVTSLIDAGSVATGAPAMAALQAWLEEAGDAIPDSYWAALPQADGEKLQLKGAVLLKVRGRLPNLDVAALHPEIQVAVNEPEAAPYRLMLQLAMQGAGTTPLLVGGALLLLAVGVVIEVLLLRALGDFGTNLLSSSQKLQLLAAIALFAGVLLGLELYTTHGAMGLGRNLEMRFRCALLHKIPRLQDRYFQSRLSSDMAERNHSIHLLRETFILLVQVLRILIVMLLTAVGILLIDPGCWLHLSSILVVTVVLPLAAQPLLTERELRQRTHAGGLMRFYLDALLGLATIRAHNAEAAFMRQYEAGLARWGRATLAFGRAAVWTESTASCWGGFLAAYLLHAHVQRAGESSAILLLAYWSLQLPMLGQNLVFTARRLAAHRNVALRLIEPLTVPDESMADGEEAIDRRRARGIALRGVTVQVAGKTVLEECSLSIAPGEHVAVVGASGAGKSTLVGLLLGWYRPAVGDVRINGELLGPDVLAALRAHTAWVDPATQLWNDTFLGNLRYGLPPANVMDSGELLDKAALQDVLARLPLGLQTLLGEGGALLSGGEGQRLRLARALARRDVQLAILDEPFRGLDRGQRRVLLGNVRAHWCEQTLLCITHDIAETLDFPRVLVMHHGRVVEDGAPHLLRARVDSRYRALLDAEQHVRQHVWRSTVWRCLRLNEGQLHGAGARSHGRVVGLE